MMRTCALIPTYNNVTTVADIVRRTLNYLPVIVVADGPTDGSLQAVCAIQSEQLTIVSYPQNRGKGYALKQGFRKARELGFTHVLTLDADGQHYPEQIPELLRLSAVRPEAIIVGSRKLKQQNMPAKNTFANRFSNFWFALQTGLRLPDTQSGFRIYPLHRLHGEWAMTNRYEAELLLLVLSCWANTTIIPAPVDVYYPPREQRVSYFVPARDFTRISVLNTILCVMAVLYGLPRRWWRALYWGTLFLMMALVANVHCLLYMLHLIDGSRLRHCISRDVRLFLRSYPGMPYTVRLAPNAEPLNDANPCIMIANHTSLLDILVMLSLSEKMIVVGADYVVHNPVYGRIARALGVITVGTGVESLLPLLREYVSQGYSVAIFPEGTRSLYGELLRFHRGAFYLAEQLQLPVRPLLLEGFWSALSKRPFFTWKPEQLSVTVLPLIRPDDTTFGCDYRERTKQVRQYYSKLLDHTLRP